MQDHAILEELLVLLEQNGVTIRSEPMGGGGGGLCKIKDKSLFFLDTQAQATDMAVICARAVHETVDIEKIYIRPQIRDFLERNR
jgi:hypothetical protein